MKITLIRHTSVDVPKGTCYGWSDVPVAETFMQEAEHTKNCISAGIFDKAYTSPLTRAKMLAEYCGFKNAEADDRLKEINMGDWEMQRFDDIKDENLQKWFDDYINHPATNGESFTMLYNRVASFLNELKSKKYAHVVIFAHGGVIMCAGIYAGLFTQEEAFDNLTPYGGTVDIEI